MDDNRIETLVASLMQAVDTLLDTVLSENSAHPQNQGLADTGDMERRLQRAVAQIDEITLGLTVATPSPSPSPTPSPSPSEPPLATGPAAWDAPRGTASVPIPATADQPVKQAPPPALARTRPTDTPRTPTNQLRDIDLSAFANLLNHGLVDLFSGQPA
jgi:hypothetical protein